MILIYKGLYQQNWKVMEQLLCEFDIKEIFIACLLLSKNSIINIVKVTVDPLGA